MDLQRQGQSQTQRLRLGRPLRYSYYPCGSDEDLLVARYSRIREIYQHMEYN